MKMSRCVGMYCVQKRLISVLIPRKDSHFNWMRPVSSRVFRPAHEARRHIPSVLADQHSSLVRYLPDSIQACMVALFTSYRLEPAVSQSGRGEERYIYWGIKM